MDIYKLSRELRKLKPFRLKVVTRKGCVPCGQVHWTEPLPTIEIRKNSSFGECNALLHEFAHVKSDYGDHGQKFRWELLELVTEYGDVSKYPWWYEYAHWYEEIDKK